MRIQLQELASSLLAQLNSVEAQLKSKRTPLRLVQVEITLRGGPVGSDDQLSVDFDVADGMSLKFEYQCLT